MNKLKLEVGKCYKTRNGRKVKITAMTCDSIYSFLGDNNGGTWSYTSHGVWEKGRESPNDLISEWEEEPETYFEQPVPGISEVRTGDKVNHPSHYTAGKVECIDAIESATTGLTGIEAVCTANAIKYLWRWKHKNGVEDLKKAQWYVKHLIERQ